MITRKKVKIDTVKDIDTKKDIDIWKIPEKQSVFFILTESITFRAG